MANSPEVDRLFIDAERWRQEADGLRGILLECGLVEEQKWGKPCYADNGKNICIIERFKDFLALLFFKGALLKDPDGILSRQGPNSRVGYRVRFTSVQDARRIGKSIKAYVHEAIEVEKASLEVGQRETTEIEYPEELIDTFGNDPDFKAAFEEVDSRTATRLHLAFRRCQTIEDAGGTHREVPPQNLRWQRIT